jgi:hypothetical protein
MTDAILRHFHARSAPFVDMSPPRRMGRRPARKCCATVRSRAFGRMSGKAVGWDSTPYLLSCPQHLPRLRTRLRGGEMSSEASSARSLAGLIDVLDRADGARGRGVPPPTGRRAPASVPCPCARSSPRRWPAPRRVLRSSRRPGRRRSPSHRGPGAARSVTGSRCGAPVPTASISPGAAPHRVLPPLRLLAGSPACAPSSSGWPCGAPARAASTSPGARSLPSTSRTPGTSTDPWCCASCPAPPRSSPRRLPPPRRNLPAVRRRRPARGERRRFPVEQWPSPA